MNENSKYLIYLLRCAVNDKKPSCKPDDVCWEDVLSLAHHNSVACTVCCAVEKLDIKPPDDIMNQFLEIKHKAIVKDIIQREENTKIMNAFEENHIRIMPLKGFLIKKYYPKSYMRVMSDLDYLIDPECGEKSLSVLKSLKYTCKNYGKGVHDVYQKPPVMNVELHRSLFSQQMIAKHGYDTNTFEQFSTADNYKYVHSMSNEDFFIYYVMHFYKHFNACGSGIRSVMDLYLMFNSLCDHINQEYIVNKLKQLGVFSFYLQMISTAETWFSDTENSVEINEAGEYIIYSGTYGNYTNYYESQIRAMGKVKFILKKLCPGMAEMRGYYPVLDKLPFLVGLCFILRLVKMVIIYHRNVSLVIKLLTKSSDSPEKTKTPAQ
ncbi:MAG: nucleotidyltransferase family protein [Oscillospiraceae bacterium]|nr:nucleotidyltransferase family protein [Oscillospiraceae bacterium]